MKNKRFVCKGVGVKFLEKQSIYFQTKSDYFGGYFGVISGVILGNVLRIYNCKKIEKFYCRVISNRMLKI